MPANDLVAHAARRFAQYHGAPPESGEKTSWTNSWPVLLKALNAAGAGNLRLLLEYELPGTGERVDAVLLGARQNGGLTAVVVELKQWDEHGAVDSTSVVLNGEIRTHPCRQAAGYAVYLRTWLDEPALDLEIRAVALLHNASRKSISELAAAVAGSDGSGSVSLIGRNDLAADRTRLAEHFLCSDLEPPGNEQVKTFLEAEHSPSRPIYERLGEVLTRDSDFVLIGEQQEAHLRVLHKIGEALHGGSHVIAVTGGPGTGKTVIAVRLLADIPKAFPSVKPRYLTRSGTIRDQLTRSAVNVDAKGLIGYLGEGIRPRGTAPEVYLVDEAQRASRNEDVVAQLLRASRVCAFFFDERQVIRPDEGMSVEGLRREANRLGARFSHVELTAQFRCGGSQEYIQWLEDLLFGTRPRSWGTSEYDLDIASNPDQLAVWIDRHARAGDRARLTGGFCWTWTRHERGKSLRPDVVIDWTDHDGGQRTWSRPWNANKEVVLDDIVVAPRRERWATDDGGHQQVGSIYTSQGLEYDYGGVILGQDLVRRGDRWQGRSEFSRDPTMRGLPSERYLPLALNTYWVLASRATRACRLYSTDHETQHFLKSLVAAV